MCVCVTINMYNQVICIFSSDATSDGKPRKQVLGRQNVYMCACVRVYVRACVRAYDIHINSIIPGHPQSPPRGTPVLMNGRNNGRNDEWMLVRR